VGTDAREPTFKLPDRSRGGGYDQQAIGCGALRALGATPDSRQGRPL